MLRVTAAGLLEAWKGRKGYDKVAMRNQVSNKRTPTLKNIFYSAVTDLVSARWNTFPLSSPVQKTDLLLLQGCSKRGRGARVMTRLP